jgi:hypothetical protein
LLLKIAENWQKITQKLAKNRRKLAKNRRKLSASRRDFFPFYVMILTIFAEIFRKIQTTASLCKRMPRTLVFADFFRPK